MADDCFDWEELGLDQAAPPREHLGTEDQAHPLAVLWIPDCEQRSGWREFYIRPVAPVRPKRSMGFRKPGGKA